jgi:hypothetical protein
MAESAPMDGIITFFSIQSCDYFVDEMDLIKITAFVKIWNSAYFLENDSIIKISSFKMAVKLFRIFV